MRRGLGGVVCCFVTAFLLVGTVVGEDGYEESLEERTTFSGVSGLIFGQIMDGYRPGDITAGSGGLRQKFNKDILLGWDFWLTLEVDLLENAKGVVSGGGNISYDLYSKYDASGALERRKQTKGSFFGITQTYLDFSFLTFDATELGLNVGYFPFRYSPHAKNLGEYLYRTEAYPNVVFTGGIDNCTPSVLGVRSYSKFFGFLTNDLIFSSESERFPFFDLSITDVVGLSVKDVFSFRAGASLWRVVPADDDITSTKLSDTDYGGIGREEFRDFFDTTEINPDTLSYTHKAVKLVSSASFDPKPLFPSEFLGEKDLIVYGEAAVLGVKDYPAFYDDIVERMPIMVGFNLPTFEILDVLAIELEQHLWEYPNTVESIYEDEAALPLLFSDFMRQNEDTRKMMRVGRTEDNFKWSIYFRKTITDHFVIQGQAAKDHLRLPDYEGRILSEPNFGAFGEWYYMLKAQYAF